MRLFTRDEDDTLSETEDGRGFAVPIPAAFLAIITEEWSDAQWAPVRKWLADRRYEIVPVAVSGKRVIGVMVALRSTRR